MERKKCWLHGLTLSRCSAGRQSVRSERVCTVWFGQSRPILSKSIILIKVRSYGHWPIAILTPAVSITRYYTHINRFGWKGCTNYMNNNLNDSNNIKSNKIGSQFNRHLENATTFMFTIGKFRVGCCIVLVASIVNVTCTLYRMSTILFKYIYWFVATKIIRYLGYKLSCSTKICRVWPHPISAIHI